MLQENGWSSGSRHTKPSPFQNGCSSKNISSNHPCCQIASAAFKYVPKQQRGLLHSLLSNSSSSTPPPPSLSINHIIHDQWSLISSPSAYKIEERLSLLVEGGTWLPHLPFSSQDDLKKSFWENNHFGRVVVWCGFNRRIIHYFKAFIVVILFY